MQDTFRSYLETGRCGNRNAPHAARGRVLVRQACQRGRCFSLCRLARCKFGALAFRSKASPRLILRRHGSDAGAHRSWRRRAVSGRVTAFFQNREVQKGIIFFCGENEGIPAYGSAAGSVCADAVCRAGRERWEAWR